MNTICHIDIQVSDLDRAQAFYEAVFGWTFRSFIPGMRVFGVGETHVGGIMQSEDIRPGNSPSIWIQVENVDETLAKAVAAGGALVDEKSEVPTVGWSTLFADLDGNWIGVVQYV